jgi:hypothetical protein
LQSQTRTASDALLQSIELAVAAEALGADGAYFRVHHFARQLGSPFPLLAACGAHLVGRRHQRHGGMGGQPAGPRSAIFVDDRAVRSVREGPRQGVEARWP